VETREFGANAWLKATNESVFKFLDQTPFPLRFFAEIWHKSAFYIPGRNTGLKKV
jgi:hypothetical protein